MLEQHPEAFDFFSRFHGDHLHVGLYDSDVTTVRQAAERATTMLVQTLKLVEPQSRVLDLGAGLGGPARELAKTSDYRVRCVHWDVAENQRNHNMNEEEGLDTRIEIVRGNPHDLPFPDESFAAVISQENLCQTVKRRDAIREIDRILKPGGVVLFTDILETYYAEDANMRLIRELLDVEKLGSLDDYREFTSRVGWEQLEIREMGANLAEHARAWKKEIEAERAAAAEEMGEDFVGKTIELMNFIEKSVDDGLLTWALFHYRKKLRSRVG
jgi:sarcosine/dimethylglycine N-methyltransferase